MRLTGGLEDERSIANRLANEEVRGGSFRGNIGDEHADMFLHIEKKQQG